MGLFVRSKDPLDERSRNVVSELERVRAEIASLRSGEVHGRVPRRPARISRSPIFEAPPLSKETSLHNESPPEVFNELGIKKYNLAHTLKRLRDQFRGPDTSNPKLVSYLAAGSIRGLKPLRYEKRVARNRFVALSFVLLLLLWGLLAVVFQSR